MTQTELISKRLDGKIAVITGGSSGLGLATAQRFVAEGAYVFIAGRSESELNAAIKQIGNSVVVFISLTTFSLSKEYQKTRSPIIANRSVDMIHTTM